MELQEKIYLAVLETVQKNQSEDEISSHPIGESVLRDIAEVIPADPMRVYAAFKHLYQTGEIEGIEDIPGTSTVLQLLTPKLTDSGYVLLDELVSKRDSAN